MKSTNDTKTTALEAIANMKVTDTTNKAEMLALCIAIAKTELSKK